MNAILVEVTPTRHQLTVMKHGVPDAVRITRLDPPPQTPGAQAHKRWTEQLAALQTTLAPWVSELNLHGRGATIIYSGPDSAASVYSVPAATGLAAARAATELAIAEAAAFPLDLATVAIHHVSTDSGPGVNADGSPRPPQMHHLAAIDSEFGASAVCQSVQNAGLAVERSLPAPAVMLAATCLEAARHARGGACAVLWMGDHGSALVVHTPQRLALARFLPHGCEQLVELLTRASASRSPSPPGAAVTESERSAARDILFQRGVSDAPPSGADVADNHSSVSLPIVRPIIQRLAIEIKQSIRFCLSAEERGSLRVMLAGPGAKIPHLESVLSADAGAGITVMQPAASSVGAVLEGESSAYSHAATLRLNLLPRARRDLERFASLRRALRIGVALAIFATALDAAQHYYLVRDQRALAARLEAEQAVPSAARHAVDRSVAARLGVSQAHARLKQLVPDSPVAAAVLAMLAEETPANIRLRGIEIAPEQGGWVARIAGTVAPDDTGDTAPADFLRRYLDRLSKSPLVTSTNLGSTRLPTTQQTFLAFDASIALVGLPIEDLRDALAGERSARAAAATETTGGRP
ncbi:MAG: hypothetical protein AB7G11_04980 [Phycisphaerales bacterium]